MNYSLSLKQELVENAPRTACCKHAYAAGLLFDLRELRENCLALVVTAAASRRECARIYRDLYRREALMNGSVMLFSSEKLYAAYRQPPEFHCKNCRANFLRGLLVSCGSVTDPAKSYHAEFRLANAEKVPFAAEFFENLGWQPKCRTIEGGVGLYFKKSTVIEDMLRMVQANNALFAMINAKLTRDIRNEENRATNFVTSNIGKTTGASAKCCLAIEKLREASRFEFLSEELRETARLRIENPEASLTELAALHEPPITKSGLNHRLQKIIAAADELVKNE